MNDEGARLMDEDPVRAIAGAVLYEGYLLWPYRRGALKNQQRFTFGGVYPAAFARIGGDRSRITMECLVEGPADAQIEVTLRFLQLVDRQPMKLAGDRWVAVDELVVGGERYVAFEEAIEREFTTGLDPASPAKGLTVEVAADEAIERLSEQAAVIRRWQPLQGLLELHATREREGVRKLSVRFQNRSLWSGAERRNALARTFLSAHLVARSPDARFVSLTDPPESLRAAADGCINEGLWPVLVGQDGRRDTMLGSPIILADHPMVAPESPGETFDNAEIDALLVHSIRAMTDDERAEMRAADPRTRALLERSLALDENQLLALHGRLDGDA